MGRKGKETKEQTSRLESLRDDCRRHPSAPIPLWRFEGEKFEIGGEGAERKRALSALDRLGAILAQSSPSRPADLRVDRALAVEAVLKAIPFRADVAIESHLEGQASGETSAVCRQRVPDVLASVAELCDAMLRGKPRRKRHNPGSVWHDAVKTLQLAREAGEDPSDAKIAKAIGVSPATFSRHVGSKDAWMDERAGRTATRRRQGNRDPDSWSDDAR